MTTDARERLLEAAQEHFYRDGIRATGVDRLVEAAQVAKMTLYHHFGSKDDLVAAYLRRRHQDWEARLAARREGEASAEGRMLAVFDAYLETASRPGHRGCPFINAAAEVPEEDHPAREVIRAHKESVRRVLREEAVAAGGPEELGDQLFLLLEGGQATAGLEGTPEPLRWARQAAERLIAAHLD